MNIHSIKPADALNFLLAGKARFGLWNQHTDNRFEYEVNASMKESSPTSFEAGGYRFTQNTTNLDFTRFFENTLDGINVEWRWDRLQ